MKYIHKSIAELSLKLNVTHTSLRSRVAAIIIPANLSDYVFHRLV